MPIKTSQAQFSLKISLITLIIISLMLKASYWQWGKYKEKTKLLKTYESNYKAEELENFDKLENFKYRKVRIKGKFNYKNQFLIANRKDVSGPGFWLLTELKLEQAKHKEQSLIVSRGFIPFKDRDKLEKYNNHKNDYVSKRQDVSNGQLYVEGVIQKSIEQKSFLSPSKTSNSNIFLFPDINTICSENKIKCVNSSYYMQKLNRDSSFPKEAISIQVPPQTHYGYTFEWIILAIISFIISAFAQLYPKKLSKFFNTRNVRIKSLLILLLAQMFFTIPAHTYATEKPEAVPKDAMIKEHLGNKLDLNLEFTLQDGKVKKLSEILSDKKPLIIAPLYYQCPRLCNLSQSGLVETLNKNKLKLGKDYNVVSISFNHKDTKESAKKFSAVYRSKLLESLDKNAWDFAVADKDTINKLMNSVGFSFKEDRGEFIHSAGMIVLTPKGVISRYFYGIQFPPSQLRLALLEAAKGKIGSSFDRIMMFCFRFDPTKGKYTLAVWNITRVLCSIFAIMLLAFIFYLKRKESKNESF